MIFAIYTCISIMALGFGWFLYKRNTELFLCLLIAVSCEFFHIPPQGIGFQYLLLPILPVLLLEGLFRGNLAMGRYGWWVLGFMAISLFGVVVAFFHGQGIVLGIKAAKFIPFVMIYFVIAGQEIRLNTFVNYFIFMALAVALLATVTSLTHGAVQVFQGLPPERIAEQMGRLRITAGQYVISAAAVVALASYLRTRNVWYLPATAALFAEVILVQQTRGFIFAIMLSGFTMYVISYRLTPIRLSIYLITLAFVFISFLVFTSSDLARIGFVERVQTDLEKKGGSYGGSLQARLNSYEYYWNEIQRSPLMGRGLLNFNWEGNPDKRMQGRYHIHLSDVGIVEFLVQSGIVGFLWLISGLFFLWKDIFFFRDQMAATSYIMIGTFTMPTLDMFFRHDSMFLFAAFLGVTSSTILAARITPHGVTKG